MLEDKGIDYSGGTFSITCRAGGYYAKTIIFCDWRSQLTQYSQYGKLAGDGIFIPVGACITLFTRQEISLPITADNQIGGTSLMVKNFTNKQQFPSRKNGGRGKF